MDFVGTFVRRYGTLNISLISGGMAYYVMLALAPMAIAIGAVSGLFVNTESVTKLWNDISADESDSLQVFDPAVSALTELAAKSSTGAATIATISSVILAIYVSQKVVYGFRNVEDQIFQRQKVSQGLVLRGWSALVALLGIVSIVGLLILLTLVPQFLQDFGVAGTVRSIVGYTQWLLPIIGVYLLVWLILARVARGSGKISWRSPGLLIATVWIVGSVGVFGLYAHLSSTIGAALVVFGAPIAILIWTFLVFIGFFIGSLVQAQIYAGSPESAGEPLRWSSDNRRNESGDCSSEAGPNDREKREK
jgi:membrane protein